MKQKTKILFGVIAGTLSACATSTPEHRIPAVEYASRAKREYAMQDPSQRAELIRTQGFQSSQNPPAATVAAFDDQKARLHLIANGTDSNAGKPETPETHSGTEKTAQFSDQEVVSNLGSENGSGPENVGYKVYESSNPNIRDYNGPLSLGDPGLSASLWKESRGGSALFRDYRAWQPMDLITIVVSENTEGKKEANTDAKQESTITAAISNFLGWENSKRLNQNVDLSNLINATSSHDFKGEGSTDRKGSLRGRISAMVAEVLPSGVLRIEGEKIIAVNSEDEIMIISGLVRPEDVSSTNEVDSSKVANVRIDYYGKGTVGDLQKAGWLGRIIRNLWPF